MTARRAERPLIAPPIVSVVLNNYNYGHFLGEAIDSALEQKGPGIEVIVVDDGSTDGSRGVLSHYGDRIIAIAQSNLGQAAAINAGVRASRGDFICFLDADDWWSANKVANIVAAFRSDPEIVLVYHRLQPVRADRSWTLKPIPRTLRSGDISNRLQTSAGWWPFPMTSAIAVRRSAWDEVGAIPDTFGISADAWLVGVYPFLGRVMALPQSLGFYRIHANNWYRSVDDAEMLRRRIAHWEATVAETNRFLIARGRRPLRMEDHLPHRIAMARLNGIGLAGRCELLWHGVRFPGEPNLARRVRDAVCAVAQLPSTGRRSDLSEIAR